MLYYIFELISRFSRYTYDIMFPCKITGSSMIMVGNEKPNISHIFLFILIVFFPTGQHVVG